MSLNPSLSDRSATYAQSLPSGLRPVSRMANAMECGPYHAFADPQCIYSYGGMTRRADLGSELHVHTDIVY